MAFPILILTLAAAVQAGPSPTHVSGPPPQRGRTFISPMGEPFRPGASGGDGLATWFQQADRNHDGSVTLDELKQDAQRFFLTLDTNHDGEIDPDELDHYESEVAPEIRSGMSWGGSTRTETDDEATGGGALGLLSIPEPVVAADTNLNRGVSALEFEQAAAKRFQMLDTDNDGRLTLPQLEALRDAIRANSRRPYRPKHTPGDTPPDGSEQEY